MREDNNVKGIIIMLLSMVGFALADTLVKVSADFMSPPQIAFYLMAGALIMFFLIAKLSGEVLDFSNAFSPIVLLRYLAEVIGMFAMVLALAHVPLSTVGAITQAAPIVVVLGAVLFLGEKISWRRGVSIMVGFLGVLLIVQPGTIAFDTNVFWAILALIGLSVRDLTTRLISSDIGSASLATYTMLAACPFSLAWVFYNGDPIIPIDVNWWIILPMIFIGSLGYWLLIVSLRIAPISVVMPFRYSRIIIMVVLGMVVFSERPNALVYLGAALIIASGVYIMWREQRVKG